MRDDAIVREIWALTKRLDDLVMPERGYSPVFLTTPYTNADFNGDSFSDVAANTIIDNASWSTTIPSNAVALLIRAECRDSGAASGLFLKLYGAAAAATPSVVVRPPAVADEHATETAIVPCTSGDIWYQINASGAGTMDVWLWCFGYWL